MSEKEMIQGLFDFIGESPTAFHAAAQICDRLDQAGFVRLSEKKVWKLTAGSKYYVTRNDSAVISFVLPEKDAVCYKIVASHLDSPCFKVKTEPEIKQGNAYVKLNTEKYGGMILSSWLDRPLSLAGRVFYEGKGGKICHSLINIDRDLLVIPNLAIHMNREINQGYAYNPQTDMLPIFSSQKERTVYDLIAEELSISKDQILSEELYVYVRQKGCLIGEDQEWMLAPRLDDLQCAYTSLQGILQAKPKDYIACSAYFDNEEVGSGTKQGADSTFLEQTMRRISRLLGFDEEQAECIRNSSFLISADNAHALHPNHPEKADLTNAPQLNGGVVIKYHGGQKYTTDGYSAACLISLCREADIPFQSYCNRSDIAGGSTLGNISTAHVSIPSADIGFAQLAMHSAVETAGAKDVMYGVRLFEQFWK